MSKKDESAEFQREAIEARQAAYRKAGDMVAASVALREAEDRYREAQRALIAASTSAERLAKEAARYRGDGDLERPFELFPMVVGRFYVTRADDTGFFVIPLRTILSDMSGTVTFAAV
jgi:hypothetical protein